MVIEFQILSISESFPDFEANIISVQSKDNLENAMSLHLKSFQVSYLSDFELCSMFIHKLAINLWGNVRFDLGHFLCISVDIAFEVWIAFKVYFRVGCPLRINFWVCFQTFCKRWFNIKNGVWYGFTIVPKLNIILDQSVIQFPTFCERCCWYWIQSLRPIQSLYSNQISILN